ncbi:hypothetical protein [Rothia sp. ZJ932]|uniref:hypothetical protein n=1 Tax=Rothia sp. ZJ932 TaxID=2810516 RepID=UPI001967572A|nr:hypothetical protein [Rothia sp. ZJ932]QRZ61673.1 hypothetical protein JR346_00540 [Rothia sp. ZJ932]
MKNPRAFYTAIVLVSALTACAPGNIQISNEKPEEQLKNSAFALSMATDYHGAGGVNNNPGGSILFYNPQSKSWSDIATGGLEKASFNFDGVNLHYYDYENDYVLTPEGTTVAAHPDHETPRIPLSFPLRHDMPGSIALSNVGVTQENGELLDNEEPLSESSTHGYRWDVIINHNGQRTSHTIGHHIVGATQCEDGSVWGRTSPYDTSFNSGYGPANSPAQFLSLYPDFSPDPQGSFNYQKFNSQSVPTICEGNTLYYFVDNFKPEITDTIGGGPKDFSGSSLISYNTKTGEFTEKEVSGDWSTRINDEMWHSQLSSAYSYNNSLWWISGSGDVIKTDLKTAHSTTVFHLADYDTKTSPGFLEFHDKYLFQIKFHKGQDADIYRFNLDTEKMEKHSTIPDIIEVEKRYQFPYDIEITNLEKMLNL